MALKIRNPEVVKPAAELARATGGSETEAVTKALRDWLVRIRRERIVRGSTSATASYAAAIHLGQPSLSKGDDFIHTDMPILRVPNG
jgi:hypothetical protein